MPLEEHQTIDAEDLDEEESDEEDDEIGLTTQHRGEGDEEGEDDDDDDDDDEEEDLNYHSSPSASSSSEDDTNKNSSADNPTVTIAATTSATVAVAPTIAAAVSPGSAVAPNGSPIVAQPTVTHSSLDHKRQRTSEVLPAAEEKKPSAFDDSRRLFQRLWTDEDEILLLQGFLEYITQRGTQNSSHHHDTGPFYDQIKSRLQLDFNKNQLVEKLRRLKKKYRNVVSRISSGKEFSFKSHHDQATFEISRKIWSGIGGRVGGVEEGGLEDDEENPQNNNNDSNTINNDVDINNSLKKVPRSRRRSRKRPAEDNLSKHQSQAASSIPNVIEDAVRSCLSPLFKELLYCAINGSCSTGALGGVTMNPLFGGVTMSPLSLNSGGTSLDISSYESMDEKWRNQQILELEVYSKRLELVQDQIKSALEKLRSMGS